MQPKSVHAHCTPIYKHCQPRRKMRESKCTYAMEHLHREKRERGSDSTAYNGVCGEGTRSIHEVHVHQVCLLNGLSARDIIAIRKRALTRSEMKINVKLTPMMIVPIAGTHHGTLGYAPVHPTKKMPMTKKGPATIAPFRRGSGGVCPRHSRRSSVYSRERYHAIPAPVVEPMPTPMKISPLRPGVKPRSSLQMMGNAEKTGEGRVSEEPKVLVDQYVRP
jgi:hypothetical protein